MNIVILGAAGFIGTNLTIQLAQDKNNKLLLVDKSEMYFGNIKAMGFDNIQIRESTLTIDTDFDNLLKNQDIVYHLVSTTVPSTSNAKIAEELMENIGFSSMLIEKCVEHKVKKVVYISSGGTVYGSKISCPINENAPTNPISAYGIQKLTIEKILHLYWHQHGLDYRVIRLANPYGPYQRPNGVLGAVTTFTYKAIKDEEIVLYGDGSVVRDFIYIDDAIKAIINVAEKDSEYKVFNIGSGEGTSIITVLRTIEKVLGTNFKIDYREGRAVDVPINYLDISRYEECFGKMDLLSLEQGIRLTADYLLKENS